VYHLPAYLALERWAVGRTVVVVMPDAPDGARRLRDAGARRVVVVGASWQGAGEGGLELRAGGPALPLADGEAGLVACVERFASLPAAARKVLLFEAFRVLEDDGLFAAWIAHGDRAATVDFWSLERELHEVFPRAAMLAQMPWHGVSIAPVLDEDARLEPALALDEALLTQPPPTSHYLALAPRGPSLEQFASEVNARALLVPLPAAPTAAVDPQVVERALTEERERASAASNDAQAQFDAMLSAAQERFDATLKEERGRFDTTLAAERERFDEVLAQERTRTGAALAQARDADEHALAEERAVSEERSRTNAALAQAREFEERARVRENDLAVLTRTLRDLEQSLARVGERADARAQELEEARTQAERLAHAQSATVAERQEVARQLDVAVAEREAARQLVVRLEAELEIVRRRAGEQEQQLAARTAEASRLAGEIQVARERLEHQEGLLAQSRTRAEELSASTAQNREQNRLLAEVAVDRDRLREELSRRSAELQKLEDRLWSARDEIQREKVDNVRVQGELERAREQAERSRAAETARTAEVERLSGELRMIELERAELVARLRGREDELARSRDDVASLAFTADLDALRTELDGRSRRLGQLEEWLEQAKARERDAGEVLRKREQQLVEAGTELERLRRNADENAALAATLQSEVDVRSLEVEQLAASVADLQRKIEEYRVTIREGDRQRDALQQQVEQTAAEREVLRRRLREREQELSDLSAQQETDGVELHKLRRELEDVANVHERLERQLRDETGDGTDDAHASWPVEALMRVRQLEQQIASQAQRLAEVASAGPRDGDRLRRHQLENDIRAQEQELMLGLLDGAEQRIWEINDASDRNAARFAASLAQLEKHQEQIDELRDELEVSRKLLAAAEARGVELERLLASERAKLARAGIGPDGLPPSLGRDSLDPDVLETLFAGLDGVETPSPEPDPAAGVPQPISDRGSTQAASRPIDLRTGPRVIVERIEEDEGDWPSTPSAPGEPEQETVPRGRRPDARGAG
jgi:hypothetical protein